MSLAKVEPFAIEQWMAKYEDSAKYNIAETCAASISLDDLRGFSDDKDGQLWFDSTKLTYGAIRGSDKLRNNLSQLYSVKKLMSKESTLITPGAIAANTITFYGLIGKGDHVICHYPTYQQLYEVPRSLGAEVDFWCSRGENDWQLSIEELKGLIKPHTKMIIVNNPHNPTGAVISKAILEQLIAVAKEHDLFVHSDEVYRPLFHSISPTAAEFPPSILSMGYKKSIATGSLSKAYSLAGIRVGWIASRSPDIIEACEQARQYTTISVSQLDDQIAAFALSNSCIHGLLARNISLAKQNLEILEKFVNNFRWACEWTKPLAGTTAFIKFSKMGKAIDDVRFCELLIQKTGVMLCPGTCFGFEFGGYVRFGFCCETQVLEQGLEAIKLFLTTDFQNVPFASDAE